MNRRMDREKINIGVYRLADYAKTERHIKEISDCGLDFVIGVDYDDRKTLDLFAKYNIGSIGNGGNPGWWGGDGNNAGKLAETNPMEKYIAASKKFIDHPALWGIDVGDEPSALDFPYYGKVIAECEKLYPNQFAYLNLYPNYASVAENNASQTVNQLGTATYDEHIAEYCKYVDTDYICYDFYLYSIDVNRAYKNLITVSDACRNSGRDMWIVLQVNSNRPAEWITENGLRFQAYTAMAYGARNITWACYTAGWWYNQVLDDKGEKTQQYDKLKKVNAEIHFLDTVYKNYRNVAAYLVGNHEFYKGETAKSIDLGFARNIKADDDNAIAVGLMTGKTDCSKTALFIAAADDPYDKNSKEYKVTFDSYKQSITAINQNGKLPVEKTGEYSYAVTVKSNDGVIIEIK